MNVIGTVTLAAPVGRVWQALYDPNVLARTIPGCTQLASAGTGCYHVAISSRAASVGGTYLGQFRLTEPHPRSSFVLRAVGQGTPGTVDATVRVRLNEAGSGTRVDYEADAVVSGMLDSMGQRLLARVATKAAEQFLAALDRELCAETAPAVPAAATELDGEPTPVPAVSAPGRKRAAGRSGQWWRTIRARYGLAAAALAGATFVLVTIVLARRARQ